MFRADMNSQEPTFSEVKALLSLIPVFKGWPLEALQDKASFWSHGTYRLQEVVEEDTLASEWIYIVTSGTMSVMKKMVKVKPKPLDKLPSPTQDLHPVPVKLRRQAWSSYKRSLLARVLSPQQQYSHVPDMLIKLDERVPGIMKSQDRLGILDYDQLLSHHKRRIARHAPPTSARDVTHAPPTSARDVTHAPPTSARDVTPAADVTARDMEVGMRGLSLHPSAVRRTSKTQGVYVDTSQPTEAKGEADREGGDRGAKDGDRRDGDKGDMTDDTGPQETATTSPPRGGLSIGEPSFFLPRLTATGAHLARGPKKKRKKKRPPTSYVFVFMQTLEKGQVFGHVDVAYPEQPSLILVSNGCEVIRINKAVFREHADINFRAHLQSVVRPYPDEATIRSNFQQSVNVTHHHKVDYLDKLKTRADRKRNKRKQFPLHADLFNYRAPHVE